jgi:hypothetical protein
MDDDDDDNDNDDDDDNDNDDDDTDIKFIWMKIRNWIVIDTLAHGFISISFSGLSYSFFGSENRLPDKNRVVVIYL